ncbi:MAG: glycosyltransferase family 1 protein [Candidatus Saccharimonadales bacterium]
MKRIVIDCRESGTSTGRYLDKLVEQIHKLKPSYEIILLAKHHRKDFLKQIAPSYRIVEASFKEFTFAEQLGFKKQINQLKADLVFFPMVQQPVWYKGRVVTAMLDLTTIRFRTHTKNWFVFTLKREVYKWVNKRVAKKSAQLITISDFVRHDIAEYCRVSTDKITVAYPSADKITDPVVPVTALQKKPFLLYVGRPGAHKNLNRLIDSYAILRKNNPDLVLVLAGKTDREYQKLREYARQKVGKGILFTGFISDGQLRWLYENAAVYVFPSLSEGFGLPGLEAMQYGLPVASSNATCLPEVYKDAAIYFNPFSSQHIAAKVQQVLDDPKLANKLRANGRKLVGTYSWQRMAKQTLAVFKKALDQ